MSGNPDASFLGKGWSFPPGFSQNGRDVAQVAEQEDIRQSLIVLLGTTPSERIMREDFGCDLHSFMFEEISQELLNRLTRLIGDAIIYNEPRIVLNSVGIEENQDNPGEIMITIDYTIRTTNSRFNLVYPFYLNEATYANV